MSTYTGNFVVVNNTGTQITSCIVCHVCSGQPTSTLAPCTLENGDKSGLVAISTQSSSKDRWSVSFLNSNNELMTGYETCGFESEDNGLTVQIILNADYFNIIMPKSSSCDDNDYDQA